MFKTSLTYFFNDMKNIKRMVSPMNNDGTVKYFVQDSECTFPRPSKNKCKGLIFTALSALLLGITPVLTSFTYSMGCTPETVTFFRMPWLVLSNIALFGIIGGGITTLLLYMSYPYVGIGTATTLHFLYPVFVCLICRIFFKEHLGLQKTIVLLIAGVGILCFLDIKELTHITGLVLAGVSV